MKNSVKFVIAAAIVAAVVASSLTLGSSSNAGAGNNNEEEAKVVRIGYFPNINHAQAVIGLGRGDFQKALGDGVEVKTQLFNAGPLAIEALFANQIDVTYVGPNPAINGYVKSDGQALRIVSGAASGGAVLVVRNDAGIDSVADFAGKKFSSPELGNTQDVALRKYLLDNGYQTSEKGGDVEVFPAKNPDIVTRMIKNDIDGAWVPEPWGAKLVKEANGRVFLDERDLWPGGDFVTAHIIVRTEFLEQNPEIVKKIIRAQVEETEWIYDNQDEAVRVFNEELKKLTGKTLPEDEFREGLSRMELTYDPVKESLFKSANDAYDVGFFKERPDLSGIYDLDILNEVLAEKGKAPIP
ncbi:MAG: ABC transporter substrate-binding protein [Nitrososphaera sp.]|uniref:ABC transporter substrate-binding protein n=1 Tax=Nitrososphaera sp. TaxID=1971748 RepID=UPI003D6DFC4A